MTSKCIWNLNRSRPPSLHDHGLQVHLQTRKIMASKCISVLNMISASEGIHKLARSQPPIASPSPPISQPPCAYLNYSISASKCHSKPPGSQPPSRSLSSTRFRPPRAFRNLRDHGLQVHLPVHTITASNCISKFSQSESPGAVANTLQYQLLPVWPYVNI
jgi:hypothetical protein